MKRLLPWCAVLALGLTPTLALAHHSFAMFDPRKVVTLNGTVRDFQWTNPHSIIWVVVLQPDGKTDAWTVELPTSPGNLARMGWTKHSLNPGDKVAVDVSPLRDGRPGGSLRKVTLVDTGQVLTAGAVAPLPTSP